MSQGLKYNVKIDFKEEGSSSTIKLEILAKSGKFKVTNLGDYKDPPFKKNTYFLVDLLNNKAFYVVPQSKKFIEMDLNDFLKLVNMGSTFTTMYFFSKLMLEKTTVSNAIRFLSLPEIKIVSPSIEIVKIPDKEILGFQCKGLQIKTKYQLQIIQKGKISESAKEEMVAQVYYYLSPEIENIFNKTNVHRMGFFLGEETFDKKADEKIGFIGLPLRIQSQTWEDDKLDSSFAFEIQEVKKIEIPEDVFQLPNGYAKINK